MIDEYEALFDSKYLRWFHVQEILDREGKTEITCTIEKVERVELTLRGGAKKWGPVVTVKGASRQLVLNRTNADTIAELYGSKPSQWVGKKFTLFVTTTKLKGKTVNCLRVKGVS
jgi:hypothetical protein